MIVTTIVSERPVTEPAGTIGALVWCLTLVDGRCSPWSCGAPGLRPACSVACVRTVVGGSAGSSNSSLALSAACDCSVRAPDGLSNDPDMAIMKFESRRLELPHQLMVVRGDDHRR